jgi:hypothetical protein
MLLFIVSIFIFLIFCKSKKASYLQEAFTIDFMNTLITVCSYLNAEIPVISIPVINKWISCVPS